MNWSSTGEILRAIGAVVGIAIGVLNHLRSASRTQVADLADRVSSLERYIGKVHDLIDIFIDRFEGAIDNLPADLRDAPRGILRDFRDAVRSGRAALHEEKPKKS